LIAAVTRKTVNLFRSVENMPPIRAGLTCETGGPPGRAADICRYGAAADCACGWGGDVPDDVQGLVELDES